MITLSPETEARLKTVASRRGLSPEATLAQVLTEVQAEFETAVAVSEAAHPVESGISPTMALFRRWSAEDATDDPEEVARRQREGDETQARLAEKRFSLQGRTEMQELDDDESSHEAAA